MNMSNVNKINLEERNFEFDLTEITTAKSGVAQTIANRVITRHTASHLARYNLTCMQWYIIGTTMEHLEDGITISQLARKMGTTIPYMTNTINLLESRKLLTKTIDENDKRTKHINVNTKKISYFEEVEESLREFLRATIYPHITREELTTYIKVLFKLSQL